MNSGPFYDRDSKQFIDPSLGKNQTALIIDDSEVNRHILLAFLKNTGYEPFTAVDGEDGLEKFKAIRPTITFLDIVMPKKSGLELLKDLKAIDQKAIVIMVSSYITKQNIQEAKNSGANWFIMKPFTKEKILEILKKFDKVPT